MSENSWEYLLRDTYWVEAERQGDYVQWVRYSHVWKPDLNGPEEVYPSEKSLNILGGQGWELVAVTCLRSRSSRAYPQQGESYSWFNVFSFIFKRPRASANGGEEPQPSLASA